MKQQSLWLCLLLGSMSFAQHTDKVEFFPLQDIRLTESRFTQAMYKDKAYMMALDADRLLAPYYKEAGLTPKAENYTNWENTGLDGHIGGHYLSALSLLYASTGDSTVKQRLEYMIDGLEQCQQANGNGYISGVPNGKQIWKEIAQGNIRAASFSLNDRWVPLYNIHKTYAGLRDAYWYAGSTKAKKMLISLTDWMIQEVAALTDEQIQEMLKSEHGGLNEVFADVYSITGEKKYLTLAKRFSQHAILDPLLENKDQLTGLHANTQIPKVIGYKRIADLENNLKWSEAADFFWHNVTEKRSVAIGGNSVSEHFNPTDDFGGMIKSIEGPETCNTYNMLKLTKELYATDPVSSYIDYYEKALYNHILSTENTEHGGFVYFTPMRPGHYRVYSQPQTSFWCCVGSGMENHAKYGEMIYAHTDRDLYVNLFIPSVLHWKEKGITLTQSNHFPEVPQTLLTFNSAPKATFNLKIRLPEWTENQFQISINGKTFDTNPDQEGYLNIARKWKKGDQISIELPMHISTEQMPDKSDYFAFKYGPLVLAARYGTEDQTGLYADDSRGGHIAHGPQIPLNDIPTLLGNATNIVSHVKAESNKPLSFHISGLYPQEKFGQGLELVPFNTIEAERYIIYWPQADTDKIEALQKAKAEEEAETRRLNMITEDQIQLGEQQPEADHFIQTKDAYTGYMEDRHFRDARGWFSYQMQNKEKNAKYLYITYFDADKNRHLNIEINGKKSHEQQLEGYKGTALQYTLISLPDSEKNKEILTVKFSAANNGLTAKIIEVRLLNSNYQR